jgi:hypothetical protein
MILNCKMRGWRFALRHDKPAPHASPDQTCDHGAAAGGALRCTCGSMLARYVPGGVELKCRRCKRTLIVPVEGAPVDGTPVDGAPVQGAPRESTG